MIAAIRLEGSIWDVLELEELPCVGEVVSLPEGDYVIASLSLDTSPRNTLYLPIISLLPVLSVRTGLTEA